MNKPNPNKTRPINRLILVGNGFDLAHRMKTSYKDFILGYFQQCWEVAKVLYLANNAKGQHVFYDDELLKITVIPSYIQQDSSLDIDFSDPKILKRLISNEYISGSQKAIHFSVKSPLLGTLINNLLEKNWVDIENYYYQALIKIITPIKNIYNNPRGIIKTDDLKKLNHDFDLIKKALEKYLLSIDISKEVEGLRNLIYEEAISDRTKPEIKNELKNLMILNFNYTKTTKSYERTNADIVHIHGELSNPSNPIIFGYGDERDETYEKLEKAKVEGVFTHIKSFDYFKTDNYSRLLAFLESEFDVYIMGHSCGLSDRTLLSTIFEHKNCRFIKVFYYDNAENYRKTTYEISRHFTDKAEMRKKVLDITKCKPMPQLK